MLGRQVVVLLLRTSLVLLSLGNPECVLLFVPPQGALLVNTVLGRMLSVCFPHPLNVFPSILVILFPFHWC